MQNCVSKLDSCFLSEDAAKLLLRLTVGILILLHGIFKITHPEAIGFIGGLFESFHLPAFLAYLVYLGEIIAPIMLIVGFKTRIAARLVAITLAVAIVLAHLPQVFTLGASGGSAIELQLMFLFGAVAIAGLGAGKYALDAKKGGEGMRM